jgi:sarcosine oxidase/L-pipecolate oxidase
MALGARLQLLENQSAIRQAFPSSTNVASLSGMTGYLNRDGGWAHASQGVSLMMDKVIAMGGNIIPGKAVETLLRHNETTSGVRCADGTEFRAQVVVLAIGSWTASSFPDLLLAEHCVATGYVSPPAAVESHPLSDLLLRQSVATIQLNHEEADKYRDCPVVLDFGSGFYIFPVRSSRTTGRIDIVSV